MTIESIFRRRILWLALAPAALALLIWAISRRGTHQAADPAIPHIEAVQGKVKLLDRGMEKPVAPGLELHSGQELDVGAQGLTIAYSRGSGQLQFAPNSYVTWQDGPDFLLNRGSVTAELDMPSADQPLVLSTIIALVRCKRCKFIAWLANSTLYVEVAHGEIEVVSRRDNKAAAVAAGERGRIGRDGIEIGPMLKVEPRGIPVTPLEPTVPDCTDLLFSHNGQYLAAASGKNSVIVWPLSKLTQPLTIDARKTRTVAFSLDDCILLSAGSDKKICLWSVADGHKLGWEEVTQGILTIVADPVDNLFLASSDYGILSQWRFLPTEKLGIRLVNTKASAQTMPGEKTEIKHGFAAAVISPDGERMAWSGKGQSRIRLHRADTGALLRLLEGHDFEVNCLAFSPVGHYLASGGRDPAAVLWNHRTGQIVTQFSRPLGPITALAFSPGGELLAAASADGTVTLWEVPSGRVRRELVLPGGGTRRLAFAPTGKVFAAAGNDGRVVIWDLSR